jgi:hypothetical protein
VRTVHKPLRTRTVVTVSALALLLAFAASGGTDEFDGRELARAWVVHSSEDTEYSVEGGWLHVDVPGQQWLWPMAGGNMDGAMFLVSPPVTPSITFETHLRFVDGDRVPFWAGAGLVIVRYGLETLNMLEASPGSRPPHIAGHWVHRDSAGEVGRPVAFRSEDVWLRFEHRAEGFALFTKDEERDPWADVTEEFRGTFLTNHFRFEPGSYRIGLFVVSGWEPGEGVEVGFDYFHSPEIRTLDVQAAGEAATVWGTLKAGAR